MKGAMNMFFRNNKLGWYGQQLNKHIISLSSGDYRSIPAVFCVFAENHNPSKEAAAKALCEALDKMTFDDLVRADTQMRQTTSMEWFVDWRKFSLTDFFTENMTEEERRAVVIFASFSPNGYIREKAVRMMMDYPGTLPFVLLRQNDWVQQVRIASIEATDNRLANLSKGELLAALPFLDKLSKAGRFQQPNKIKNRILTALVSKMSEDDFRIGLQCRNIRTRRICINALFDTETPRFDLAIEHLQIESDPFLRATIFRRLRDNSQNINKVAVQFLKDKYPLNRVLAFQYLCDTENASIHDIAIELLLDRSAVVREEARRYLSSKCEDFDYRTYYKSKLSSKTTQAIYGLGEIGKLEDTAYIEIYLQSDKISVVRAAMTALMRLDSTKYTSQITEFLNDEHAGIVKNACNLIIKYALPDYERVMEIFRATSFENTKLKCLRILLTAGKWQRLIFILEVLEHSKGDIAEKAEDAINRWILSFNRSYIQATPSQITAIQEIIERLDSRIPKPLKKQILFLIR